MTTPKNDRDYAIVLGINLYQEASLFPDLRGAERDAQEFRRWLVSDRGGRLPPENVLPRFNEQFEPLPKFEPRQGPRQQYVFDQFGEIMKRCKPSSNKYFGRRLYIFLSGHGGGHPGRAGQHETHDTRLFTALDSNSTYEAVAAILYAELFAGAGVFEEVILLMDCCRDDKYWLPQQPQIGHSLSLRPELAAGVRKYYAFATRALLRARERDWGTGFWRGIFSRAVLEGLETLAPNAHGHITTRQLHDFVSERVRQLRPDDSNQEPHFLALDDFPLVERLPSVPEAPDLRVPVRVKLTPGHADFLVLTGINPEIRFRDERRQIGAGEYEVALPPGRLYLFVVPSLHNGADYSVMKGRHVKAPIHQQEVLHVEL